MEMKKEIYGWIGSEPVTLYTIFNNAGLEFSCMDYGCVITKIKVPDRSGKVENIVLSYDNLEDYKDDAHYIGAIAGRVAGRIKHGFFTLANEEVQLSQNDQDHHLHGGTNGFSKALWNSEAVETEDGISIEFSRLSLDGEEGYPGNVRMKVKYTIYKDQNKLLIQNTGETDQTTLLNVTNHSYFNLSGNMKNHILGHELFMDSERFLELDDESIPTGKILPVEKTVFDFQNKRRISEGVQSKDPQIELVGGGFDHPFLLNKKRRAEIVLADPSSGRQLTMETSEPAVVFYTGNGLSGARLAGGLTSGNFAGLCLETQGTPDSVNHPHFDSSVLKPNERYSSWTKYSFSLE